MCTITYMELSSSIVRHPSNDHVRVWHLSVGRDPEAYPARGLHTDGERNGFRDIVERPVQFVEASFHFGIQGSFE